LTTTGIDDQSVNIISICQEHGLKIDLINVSCIICPWSHYTWFRENERNVFKIYKQNLFLQYRIAKFNWSI